MTARRAVSICFLLNGLVLASWLPHIPELKSRLALSDGRLGFLLLAMAVGAVAALPTAGWLIARFGSGAVTRVSAAALSLAVTLPMVSPGVVASAAALAVLGICNAVLDVAMNAQAVLVEKDYGRPIMSSFHALFSLGGLLGAGGASLAMVAGLNAITHLALVALLGLAAIVLAAPHLVPTSRSPGLAQAGFVVPPAAFLSLGLLAFCALLVEGAIGDWSAVYLRDSLGTSAAIAAMGFAAFSLAMALGRLAGDALARRLGGPRLLRHRRCGHRRLPRLSRRAAPHRACRRCGGAAHGARHRLRSLRPRGRGRRAHSPAPRSPNSASGARGRHLERGGIPWLNCSNTSRSRPSSTGAATAMPTWETFPRRSSTASRARCASTMAWPKDLPWRPPSTTSWPLSRAECTARCAAP